MERSPRAPDEDDPCQTLFFCALPALVVLGSCRQGDDIVATLKGPETGVPPIEDAGSPLPDVSIDRAAPPAMDSEVPRPDVMLEDVFIPPIDVIQPPSCEANGPGLTIRRMNGETYESCAGQLAAHTFTHALCACEDLNIPTISQLTTDSFDSSGADKTVLGSGAAVGVTGNYPAARSYIGGSLTVAGTSRLLNMTDLDVQGDLKLAGRASLWSWVRVKRDTWLMSPVGYWAMVRIEGNLNLLAPTGSLNGVGEPFLGGMRITTSFTVDDPCGCGEQRLDVAEIARLGAERNDNAALSIDRAAFTNLIGTTRLALPCGRFRFDSIGGPGSLQLAFTGRTAIFVDRDVALPELQLLLANDAEVDVFIRGNLSLATAKLGDMNRPAALRIYVGGANDIVFAGGEIGANVYAPNANVTLAVPTGLGGSIYAKNLHTSAGGIHYDRAILKAGDKCGQPTTCDKSSRSCHISATCNNGVCEKCKEDRECSAPLVCVTGACQPLLFQ